MEPEIRDNLEQEIEDITTPVYLDTIIHEMERNFPFKTIEDLVFGAIVGRLWGRWTVFSKQRGIDNRESTREFWGMMRERAMEIRGRILVALNK